MIKVLVVGYKGKVGSALYELLCGMNEFEVYALDIDDEMDVPKNLNIMHICYVFKSEREFIETTVQYIRNFNPTLTIINSTVMPTVTNKIFHKTKKPIVHSPVRGMHPYLKHDLLHYVKFIGAVDKKAGEMAKKHFEKLGMKTYICKSTKETEFAKLFATSYYALMIGWFQEMQRICTENSVEYDQIVEFIKTEEDKPVLHAGYIGGDCLIPNINLLLQKCESKFLQATLESNERLKNKALEKNVRGTLRRDKWRFESNKIPYE